MMIMLIILLATICISVYLFLTRQAHGLHPSPDQLTRDAARHKLMMLLVVMLGSLLLIMLFVIGSYLFMRIGREVAQKPVGGEPTEYSDAWSNYRVSDEEIAAATREDAGENGDDPAKPPEDPRNSPEG